MPATLKDIAKRVGVTSATVSMVINNKPNISEATREKVLAVAKELNYYPNVIARGLATRKTNAIGIIVPNLASSFVVRVLQGVKSTIREEDYTVLLFDTIGSKESEQGVFQRVVREGRVDGVIIIGSAMIDEELKLFERENMPAVLVARRSDIIDSIYVNHLLASKEATQYLLNKGHRKIAVVTSGEKHIPTKERLNGYKEALVEQNIPFDEGLHFRIEEEAMAHAGRIVPRILENRPDAVYCPCGDMAAIGIIKALRKNGVSVPGDIAVMGYDDIPAAEVVEPALTTVRQPKLEMGDFAINMLLDKVEGREKDTKHKELMSKLIIRESA